MSSDTSTMQHQIPRFLMVTSSILVEWLFRITTSPRDWTTKLRDRVLIQVLLWLTSSLPSSPPSNTKDNAFEMLINTIFFSNVSVIFLTALSSGIPHGHRKQSSSSSFTTRNMCVSFLEKVSPSLWGALVWALVEDREQQEANRSVEQEKYWQRAASLLCVLCILVVAQRFYRTVNPQKHVIFWPFTKGLEASNWQNWTVKDVTHWLMETYPLLADDDDDDGDNDEFRRIILPRLAWEGIDGKMLHMLDKDALRNMDIPYGTTCSLLEHIHERLTERYPPSYPQKRALCSTITTESVPDNTFLSQFDHEYSLPLSERLKQQRESRSSWSHRDLPLNDSEQEYVREQIFQRWGLDLPELAKQEEAKKDAIVGTVKDEEAVPLEDLVTPPQEPQEEARRMEVSLLQTMPPHIRDIIQRKPHLWKQVQALGNPEHQEQSEQIQDEMSSPVEPQMHLQSLPPHIREVAERNPQLFQQMHNANNQQGLRTYRSIQSPLTTATEELYEDEYDEINPVVSVKGEPFEDEYDETQSLLPKPDSIKNSEREFRLRL